MCHIRLMLKMIEISKRILPNCRDMGFKATCVIVRKLSHLIYALEVWHHFDSILIYRSWLQCLSKLKPELHRVNIPCGLKKLPCNFLSCFLFDFKCFWFLSLFLRLLLFLAGSVVFSEGHLYLSLQLQSLTSTNFDRLGHYKLWFLRFLRNEFGYRLNFLRYLF